MENDTSKNVATSIAQNFWSILTNILNTAQNAQDQFGTIAKKRANKEYIELEKLFEIFDSLTNQITELPLTIEQATKTINTIVDSIRLSRSGIKNSVDIMLEKTSSQLGKVTDATESATNNILDVTEELMDSQNDIVEKLEETKETGKNGIDELINLVNTNQDKTFQIMDFLQFQDITNQQIEGIMGVLNETERKLGNVLVMLTNLEGKDGEKVKREIEQKTTHYDKDAEFKDKKEAQNLIDDLFD